jgi:tetratricopeptide (TPR) repeat protein
MFGDEIQRAKSLPKDDGERLLEDVLLLQRARAPKPDVANLLLHLATYACDAYRFDVALKRAKEATRLYQRACGADDARTRHAQSQVAHVLERSGDIVGAVAATRALDPDDARPAWRWQELAELEARAGDHESATRSLEAARAGAGADGHDPMTHVESLLRTARALDADGRREEAVALLDGALARLDDIEAGRRISPSARVPSQVRELLGAALARLRPPS